MAKYPLYEKAKKCLWREYDEVFEIVKDSPYHRAFANEKIKHSFQVSGAGNGILKNEQCFKFESDDYLDVCRSAVLLHDIYRFKEVLGWFQTGQKIDHGVEGARYLKTMPDFNNILITLPIKHHGHMIEKLYEDPEYQSLDDDLKDKVKHISFAVRDADKIANWCLLCNSWNNKEIQDVWLPAPDDFSSAQGKINDELWTCFVRDEVAPNNLRRTNADAAVAIICWLFDMNYDYSIYYSKKLNLFDGFCNILEKLKADESHIKIVRQNMKQYVLKRFHVEI